MRLGLQLCAVLLAFAFASMTAVVFAQSLAEREDAVFVLFGKGQRDAAYEELVQLARDPNASARVFLYKGVTERDRKQLDAAVETFRAGLTHAPKDISLQLELATTLSWNHDLLAAQHTYEDVLKQEPSNLSAMNGRARVLAWQGDSNAARAGFSDVLARDAKNKEALEGLAAIDAERHTQILAQGGVLDTNAATLDFIGGLSLARDLTPELRASINYRAEGVEVARDLSLIGQRKRAVVHKLGAIGVWRPTQVLTLNAGYEVTLSDIRPDHAIDAGAGFRIHELVSVLAGVRFYMGHGFGMLDNVGVLVSYMADSYVLVQGFRYDDFEVDHGQTAVLSVRQALLDNLAIKLSGGYGTHTRTGTQKSFGAGIDIGLTRDLHVGADYEYFTANFFRHQALAFIRYDLP